MSWMLPKAGIRTRENDIFPSCDKRGERERNVWQRIWLSRSLPSWWLFIVTVGCQAGDLKHFKVRFFKCPVCRTARTLCTQVCCPIYRTPGLKGLNHEQQIWFVCKLRLYRVRNPDPQWGRQKHNTLPLGSWYDHNLSWRRRRLFTGIRDLGLRFCIQPTRTLGVGLSLIER